jgi:hypothetical protein
VWFSKQTSSGWVPKVSTAAGGRDTDEVASDLEAYTNFAHALNELIATAYLMVSVS